MSTREALSEIETQVKKEFDANKRVLAFSEYLQLLAEAPELQLRSSTDLLVGMLDHFGKSQIQELGRTSTESFRFHVFDVPVDGLSPKVVGQERVQTRLYRAVRAFQGQKLNNKLLLLHGPNGSAKSTIARSLMAGLERYSRTKEGAAYTFNWIFPVEKITKGNLGLQAYSKNADPLTSFAKLSDDEVVARFPCDLKDHPFLVIPQEQRLGVLKRVLGEQRAETVYKSLSNYLTKGDLCHRCRLIFDSLLSAHHGDYERVLMHLQIERFFFSRRYRKGLVTIEPQLHVDAQYAQLTYNKSLGALPASLQSINFFTLSGDLVDGNRGIIEYADLLKRPVDSYKYLLGACETGAINVGHAIAHLDTVMIGSSNELQLDGFKEFPDFGSFKARMELVRVPYLLSMTQEREIYQLHLGELGTEKHVAPHVAQTLALWAILTRLKKPNSINYPPSVSSIVASLTPIQKAKLYDKGDMPEHLSPEDRKILRSQIGKLREEYETIPFYEGRMGASVREMKAILFDAAQNSEFPCVSPLAIFRELEGFVKRANEYEFLKQDVKESFHDASEFINTVREEYLDTIDREVRSAIGLYDTKQWEEFIQKYVLHLSLTLKKERMQNTVTGKSEDPDLSLLQEFERIVDAPKDEKELLAFRKNVISQVGAWSLDHRGQTVVYSQVFPEYWRKLEKHYYEQQRAELEKMNNSLQVYGTDQYDPYSEGSKLAAQTVTNMKKNMGYCENCAKEVVGLLMKRRT